MKKIVIVCGLIAGGIVSAMMLITMAIYKSSGDFDNGMIYGYASMLLAFSLIFVGIKNYRDNYNNGIISFGKAFKIGILITLIASSIYVIVWLIDYYFFIPDFGEKYAAHMLEKLKVSGASEIEIAKQTKEMASFSTMYKNPFFNALMTYAEIIPVGLIITLISSLILKRKVKT
jgi:ethanolamine transporter EutH